jgi:hypothetical protein
MIISIGKKFGSPGVADDLAVICRNKEELNIAINRLEEWSRANEIAVNKKKNGIMIVYNDRRNMNEHRGYRIKIFTSI